MTLQVLTAFGVIKGVGLPTQSLDRDEIDPASLFPDESNTGHTSQVGDLEIVSGSISYGTPGETIVGKRFQNWVSVTAANVTFRDCLFEGPPSTAGFEKGLVTCTNANVQNLVFKDCTFKPQAPTSGTAGVVGHDFTAIRCRVSHVVDAFDPAVRAGSTTVNVTIRNCWINDLAFFSPDPYHPSVTDNKSHNDGIQVHGGRNVLIEYNRIESFYTTDVGNANEPSVDSGTTHISGNPYWPNMAGTSAIIFSNITYPPGAVTIRGNWIDGGAVGINLAGSTGSFLTQEDQAVVTGNRFGTGFRLGPDFAVMKKSNQYANVTGNVRWNKNNPWDVSSSFNTVKPG